VRSVAGPQELFSACNPIINKPKPKVELPKDDKAGEQNGPVNGQEKPAGDSATAAAADTTTTGSAENAASASTDSKPDMDLD